MLSAYNILKFIHVASITVLTGGAVMMLAINMRLTKIGAREAAAAVMGQGKFLSTRLFMPSALVAIVTGIGLVQMGNIGFDKIWIMYGFAGFFTSLFVGTFLVARKAARLGRMVADGTATPEIFTAERKKIFTLVTINIIIMFSIIFMMVTKLT